MSFVILLVINKGDNTIVVSNALLPSYHSRQSKGFVCTLRAHTRVREAYSSCMMTCVQCIFRCDRRIYMPKGTHHGSMTALRRHHIRHTKTT